MNPSYISAIVMILSVVLSRMGVSIGNDALTTTLVTLVQIVGALTVVVHQIKSGQSNIFGGTIK